MTTPRRAELLLAGVALAVGLGGLIAARDLSLTADGGAILLGLGVSFNPLGALITAVLAALAAAGALVGRRALVILAAAGYTLASIQVLLQFGRDSNWFGSRGSNLSFAVALAVGLSSLVWLEQQESEP